MASIRINDETYEGEKISIDDGIIYVDGAPQNFLPIPGIPSVEISDPLSD